MTKMIKFKNKCKKRLNVGRILVRLATGLETGLGRILVGLVTGLETGPVEY